MTTTAGEAPAPDDRLDRQTVAIVAVLAMAAFMSVLDGTIVTVAVDTFANVFEAPVSTVVWVSVAYLMAAAVALPTSGMAIERWGGRRVFLAGLALFLTGSALASVAWSAPSLIAFRVIQGLGGGALEPTALTLAATLAGPRRMGRVMGVLTMVINIAPVLGPLTGGVFATEAHWRWIFLINLPIGVVVAIFAASLLPGKLDTTEPVRPDLRGLFLLAPGFAGLLLAVDRFGARAAVWAIGVPAAAGAGLLALYVRRARRVPEPVVDLRLLRRPGFGVSVAVMATVGLTMYSQLLALPLLLHRDHGYTGVGQGLLTTALGLGLLVSMSQSSRLSDRTGPRPWVSAGSPVTAAGLGTFAATYHDLPVAGAFALFVVVGLGFGCVAAPTFSSVYRTVPDVAAQGTTMMFIVVQLSASLGITVIGLTLSGSDTDAIGPLFAALAVIAVAAGRLSRWLPGAPTGDPAPTDTPAEVIAPAEVEAVQ
jgi:EmrB/QacA subfamily drug resistance transporter